MTLKYKSMIISIFVLFILGIFLWVHEDICISYLIYKDQKEIRNVEGKKHHLNESKSMNVINQLQINNTVVLEPIKFIFLGVDSRENIKTGRSDVNMIIYVDFIKRKIKIVSIMRDLRVAIENYGNTKLGHGYAFGGAKLATETINRNLDMNIKNYMVFNFYDIEKAIDILGGIHLLISNDEMKEINRMVKELSFYDGNKGDLLSSYGNIRVTGRQAVAYSRIRYVGNGDFERIERQFRVVEAILNQIENSDIMVLLELYELFKTDIETNIDMLIYFDLIENTNNKTENYKIMHKRFPEDNTYSEDISTGVYYIIPNDLDKMSKVIKNYLLSQD